MAEPRNVSVAPLAPSAAGIYSGQVFQTGLPQRIEGTGGITAQLLGHVWQLGLDQSYIIFPEIDATDLPPHTHSATDIVNLKSGGMAAGLMSAGGETNMTGRLKLAFPGVAASINFPLGQDPVAPANGDMWQNDNAHLMVRLNGVSYQVAPGTPPGEGGGGAAATYIGDTPPSSPIVGQLWFRSDSGMSYIWLNDGSSSQWVALMAPPPPSTTTVTTTNIITTKVDAAASGLMVPYYLYPNNPYSDATVQRLVGLIKKYHRIPVLVIINPSDGPGTVWDGNYSAFIKVLQGAGAKVCGYVSTAYAVRPEDDVRADISKWMSLYSDAPIDGIFLDEQTWETGPGNVGTQYVDLYKRYTDFCHSANLYPVIGNPGTNQQQAYFAVNTSDIIVVHEQTTYPSEASMAGLFPGGHADYSYTRRAALVYNQPTLVTASLDTLRKHTQWVYVTDDNLTGGLLNPWDALPTYLEGLFAALND